MKILSIVLLAVGLLVPTAPAHSDQMVFDTISLPAEDCSSPRVASSDAGVTVVAFVHDGALTMSFVSTMIVPTEALPTSLPDADGGKFPDFWGDPVGLGAGYAAEVCWSRDGFTLAKTDGLMLTLIQGDHEGVWDPATTHLIPAGGDVVSMDLYGIPHTSLEPDHPDVYLTWTVCGPSGPYAGDARCYFACCTDGVWSEPELVAENLPWAWSQVSWESSLFDTNAVVFYPAVGQDGTMLMARTWNVGWVWSDPVPVPDGLGGLNTPLGGPFAVTRNSDGEWAILGLGPQPTCPCGTVIYQHTEAQVWQPFQDLTMDHGHYDQPLSPRLTAGLDGQVHAFWHQLDTSGDLIPHQAYLEYHVAQDGLWEDAGDFLDAEPGGGLKAQLDLAVSPQGRPVLAWARRDTVEGVPGNQVIRLARHGQNGPAAAPPAATPLVMKAWPNPFNPRVTVSCELDGPQDLHLAVFDARGRLVRRLLDGPQPAGTVRAVWDGRDERGAAAPSGLYFARLLSGQGTQTRKLVLAR